MFNNVGGKLKVLAKVAWIVTVIVAIIVFIIGCAFSQDTDGLSFVLAFFLGIPLMLLGGAISSWFVYAFGDIYEKICKSQPTAVEKLPNFPSTHVDPQNFNNIQ